MSNSFNNQRGRFMPLIQATIMEGRSQEQKEAFYQGITQVVVDTLNVKPEQVRVVIQEVPKTHWAIGGISVAKRNANS
ncbi:MAG: 2-hydroxymuconate tautomerase family protein [Candidatus Thiodiazotropha taylori]|nr:2-hydroxymuconate tautomerase family protein [Candidatus Thiodiazotropha taylori]